MNRHVCKTLCLSLTLLTLASAPAWAETTPYYIGVTQGISYDSNVFKDIDARARSSWWGTTGVVGGFDQLYRRQRFYASGNVSANYYSSLGQLDNTSYALNGGWDWQTIEHLSGTLTVAAAQNLGNYGGQFQTLIDTKNIQTSGSAFATADYGLPSLWQLNGRLGYSTVHYSSLQYARYELTQETVSLGMRKQFSGQLTVGTGLTYTYVDYFSLGERYNRYDLYLSGRWLATGLSTVSGRLNYSVRDYKDEINQNDDGLTGWVRWEYAATGKLGFNTLLSYDTLANSTLTNTGGTPVYLGSSNRLTAAVQLEATYQATSKVQVNAALNYYTRKRDRPGISSGGSLIAVEARDQVTVLSLGANWTPTRNWLVACSLNSNTRNSSASQPISLTPYDSWGGSCSAQFALQ